MAVRLTTLQIAFELDPRIRLARTGGLPIHPELVAEQARIDHAYDCLERSRALATRLTSMVEVGAGGTQQARYEREAIYENVLNRLHQLDLGDHSLVFGRLDFNPDAGDDTLYVGRLGVWDAAQDAVVVDWRAPAAEPFYRATGRDPMGLLRRRHFASRGRTLLGIDDELFGVWSETTDDTGRLRGHGALISALEMARTGQLGDIVGTIQAEQDEIIRASLPGIVVVQGGPGTGKTVVALHRAAYLLYTHRFPLNGQGVLVVGPNRLFLAYIEQVLPSLGEAGVEMATVGDVIPHVRVDGFDPEPVARLKGDLRMVDVIRRAVRTRQQPLRRDAVVGHGIERLRVTVAQSATIVSEARRRFRTHNQARRFVEEEFFRLLADSSHQPLEADGLRERMSRTREIRELLDWMWPVLTPSHLLHDLFGSKALLRVASRPYLEAGEIDLLGRARSTHADNVVWTRSDAPLLDEARSWLGPRPTHKQDDAIRTYGHIVVDEAQDLTPMELRVLRRRSLNGSMTIVGDIAQATGPWARDDWTAVVAELVQRHEPRLFDLTIGYRIPAPLMAMAARVQKAAVPGLTPPRSVRVDGDPPRIVAAHGRFGPTLVDVVRDELAAAAPGNVAVITPLSMVAEVEALLAEAGLPFGRASRSGLRESLAVVPAPLVKGLEVDAAVVVEPGRIVDEEVQGLRALYVALTRATRRLAIVHDLPLPPVMLE